MRNTISSFFFRRQTLCIACLLAFVLMISLTTFAQKTAELQTVNAAGNSGSGSITVKVTADGGRPLVEAMLFFSRVGGGSTISARVVTNENGEYVFRGLTPGLYNVSANYSGYTSLGITNLTYPERKSSFLPGDNIVINFTKGGVITGRVTDQSGQPMVTMDVKALRAVDIQGRRVFGAAYSAQTDDRGIYRIFGLAAGSYIVSVSGKQAPGRFNTNPYYDSLPTFYPANSRGSARKIAVTVGGEASGIDITFGPATGHSISGKITNPVWTANSNVSIRLSQIDASDSGQSLNIGAETPDHSFQFTGVEEGEYEIFGTYIQSGVQTSRGRTQRFKVKGNDVSGINLMLVPTSTISGKFIFEAAPASGQDTCQQKPPAPFAEIMVSAKVDDHGDSTVAAEYGRVAGDKGDFLIPGMEAGHYVMGARLPNDDMYVASIVDTGGRPTAMKSGASKGVSDLPNLVTIGSSDKDSGIVIKLANGAAGISGSLALSGQGPITPDSFRVYLLPADRDFLNEATRYYERTIGKDGKFAIKNLAQGKYWIVALPTPKKGSGAPTSGQLIFDYGFRATIRKEAEANGVQFDLKPCQRVNDVSLRVQ